MITHADIIRIGEGAIDIKVTTEKDMHVLQWRRHMLFDEILLDGKRQQISKGLFNRENIYGLVFGRDDDGNGGQRVIFTIDGRHDWSDYATLGFSIARGIRLEASDRVILAYGSLDPQQFERPQTFLDATRKALGMHWGN